MEMTYELCDKCGKSIPLGTGAIVMKRTVKKAFPTMHLCESCFYDTFPKSKETEEEEE